MAPRGTTLPQAATESAREARKSFFCDLCQKGYARSNDFEAHENSYDHQHRKRLKDLRQMTKDPNAAAKAREAEQASSDLKSVDLFSLSSSSTTTTKKKPVFKSTLQPHNAAALSSQPSTSSVAATELMGGSVDAGSGDARANVNVPELSMKDGTSTDVGGGDDPSRARENGWEAERWTPMGARLRAKDPEVRVRKRELMSRMEKRFTAEGGSHRVEVLEGRRVLMREGVPPPMGWSEFQKLRGEVYAG